jgi:hypothetical protein
VALSVTHLVGGVVGQSGTGITWWLCLGVTGRGLLAVVAMQWGSSFM